MGNNKFSSEFKGKVILITGSEGKLGKAIKKTYLDRGARIYGIDIKKSNQKKKYSLSLSFKFLYE